MADDINKIVLLGTDRSAIPDSWRVGEEIQSDAGKVLLRRVAQTSMLDKGAIRLLEVGPAPDPAYGRPFHLPPAALRHALQRVCAGTFRPCLAEILDQIQKEEADLPPESWPALLELSGEDEDLAVFLSQHGHIGLSHYASHYPEWRHLAEPDGNIWSLASLGERQSLLKALLLFGRAEEAVELMESTWAEESADQKAALLSSLDFHIGPVAIPLLERAVEDRRKEVRREAARLLVAIPGAPLQDAWLQMAGEFMVLEDGRANYHPQGEKLKQWINYGLLTNKRDAQIKTILEQTPPGFWSQHWGVSDREVIEAFHRSIQSRIAVPAFMESCVQSSSGKVADAWLAYWSRHSTIGHWEGRREKAILAMVPRQAARKAALAYLRQQKSLLAERHLVTRLLLENKEVWSEQIALLVINRFQDWLSQATAYHWDTLHYKSLLRQIAYYCPPEAFGKLLKSWPRDAPMWGAWEKEVEHMIRIMNFRRAYQKVD